MSRLNHQSWFASRLDRPSKPRHNASRYLIGSSFGRRLHIEALEDRRMLAGVEGFTGPYAISNWINLGILDGFTSMSPVFGDSPTADFHYEVDLPGGGVSQRTADFTLANSLVTGSVTFDYTYTGNHRYYQAEAEFSTVYGGSVLSVVVDSPTSGSFNFSGSASLVAFAGDSFGFRIGGQNFDSSSHIDGTLTISNITFHDSLVVDSPDDELDFDLSLGNLSLREAVYIANFIPGADKITIAPNLSGQTISLDMGELEITESLTIDASELAAPLTIDGQQLSRVLNFSALSGDLTLAGLTITGGKTVADLDFGGGIRFLPTYSALTLTQCTVSGNSTTGMVSVGGGIFSYGAVAITQSTVSGNSTTGDSAPGGGIWALGALTLTESTVSGNSTSGYLSSGGGIYAKGALTLNQSTVSGNSTFGNVSHGGGIFANAALTLVHSTVSGNGTTGVMSYGGGIFAYEAVTLTQTTVTDNRTTGYSSGGGGVVQDNAFPLTIENSIVAGNIADIGPDLVPDSGTVPTIRFSIIGDNDFSGLTPSPTPDANGNIIGTHAVPFDPKLAPLADNGGPTLPNGATILTHALLPDSPAIDRGDPAVAFNPAEFDQRGAPFVRVVGTRVDMGAVESPYVIVNSAGGGDDGIPTNGITTLREAINLANPTTSVDETVLFASNMSGQTILPGGAEMVITDTLTIDATALDENVTIDGQQLSRVLNFDDFGGDLTLAGLTITGGKTVSDVDRGAGIRFLSFGGLTLVESTVSGNSTIGTFSDGGGIYSLGATTLTESTVSGNSTSGSGSYGGGIWTYFGLILTQSTVSGNRTTGNNSFGGGIFAKRAVTISHSTITLNRADNASGGGLHMEGFNLADLTIRNSIIAGNTAGDFGADLAPDFTGTQTITFSLIGDEDGSGLTPSPTPDANGNLVGTHISPIDPKLGPLANNGGPTQTHALLPGSPALDAGDPNAGADHAYEINNSLADALGGPALDEEGGALTPIGYQFGPNEGLDLSSAVAADEYSIELVFSFDALGGYQKIIDFKNLTDDTGLYSTGNDLHFFDAAFAADVLTAGELTHLVITRDGPTDRVAVYLNGVEVMNFIDVNDRGVFSGTNQIIRFFQDDNTTGQTDAASGFVDRIHIYDRDLSADEVRNIALDQRGVGFNRVADGDGLGGARIDIGAYESQARPSADFDDDGDVDGRDFLTWQRGFGTPNAVRANGDSDADADVDGSDLVAWQGQYGATGLNDLVAASLDERAGSSPSPSLSPTELLSGSGTSRLAALAFADPLFHRETASDTQTAFEESYVEEVDRALEQFALAPTGARSFGEMVARRRMSTTPRLSSHLYDFRAVS